MDCEGVFVKKTTECELIEQNLGEGSGGIRATAFHFSLTIWSNCLDYLWGTSRCGTESSNLLVQISRYCADWSVFCCRPGKRSSGDPFWGVYRARA
jgi:hypothetical protein